MYGQQGFCRTVLVLLHRRQVWYFPAGDTKEMQKLCHWHSQPLWVQVLYILSLPGQTMTNKMKPAE
jgi:hypothetical protein